jgi:hypothetical protein
MAFNKTFTGSSAPWKSAACFHNSNLNFGAQTYSTRVNNILTGKQWLYIDCLIPQTFSGFKMHFLANNMNDRPKEYHIAGSNDNVNFTSLFYTSNEQYTGNSVSHGLSTGSYRYYRLVVLNIMDHSNGLNHSTYVEELIFYKPKIISTDYAPSTVETDVNKLVNLLNTWLSNGTIPFNGISMGSDKIRNAW